MEAAILDEKMEVSTDMGGMYDHFNDIEIELDDTGFLNHDDNDVIVDDAPGTEMNEPGVAESNHLPPGDADMVEFEIEEQYHNNETQDGEYQFVDEQQIIDEESFGVDDDYEEDIDAPIPGTGVIEQGHFAEAAAYDADTAQKTPSLDNSASKNDQGERNVDGSNHQQGISVNIDKEASRRGDDNNNTQSHEILELPQQEEPVQPEHHDDVYTGPEDYTEEQAADGNIFPTPTTGETNKVTDVTHEAGQDDRFLHSIKVLYLENEISLFPPKENDLSETYFLENESLAYESIKDLLESCRLVLGDHIGAEEELCLEIDCLGLRLNEFTTQATDVSLSQIVQVYLDLSSNDGATNPEPLFITLATQPTFAHSFHNLSEAAQAGKGLSQIDDWQNYEDYQDEAVEEYAVEEEQQQHTDPQEIEEEAVERSPEPTGVADLQVPPVEGGTGAGSDPTSPKVTTPVDNDGVVDEVDNSESVEEKDLQEETETSPRNAVEYPESGEYDGFDDQGHEEMDHPSMQADNENTEAIVENASQEAARSEEFPQTEQELTEAIASEDLGVEEPLAASSDDTPEPSAVPPRDGEQPKDDADGLLTAETNGQDDQIEIHLESENHDDKHANGNSLIQPESDVHGEDEGSLSENIEDGELVDDYVAVGSFTAKATGAPATPEVGETFEIDDNLYNNSFSVDNLNALEEFDSTEFFEGTAESSAFAFEAKVLAGGEVFETNNENENVINVMGESTARGMSPLPSKRARVEDDSSNLEGSVPDLKRQRSEQWQH